jgi:hypothetical protein
MAKLILDTSTWLDLAKPRIEEVLTELEEQIKQGITVLLTCDIIIEEWERNKPRVLKSAVASIRDHAKSALKMSELLPEEEKTKLIKIIKKYTMIESDQQRLAEGFFERVERLLKTSETFTINDQIKVDMANRAITKRAPFHNSKNNMADALLYYGAIEHVNRTTQIANELIFVTSNHREFSDPNNLAIIHPDLHHGNVHFSNNLAQALRMRKDLIDLMDEYNEFRLLEWITKDFDRD